MTVTPTLPAPRAGRDLPMAIAVGLAMAGALLVCVFVAKPAFVGLAVLAVLVATWELDTAFRPRGIQVAPIPLGLGAGLTLVLAYRDGAVGALLGLTLTAAVLLVWHAALPRPQGSPLTHLAGSLFLLGYLTALASFAVLLLRPEDGAKRLVVFVLMVVCNDVGGYATGVLWGRHPIAPSVSPKKSWEGASGSLTLCLVAGGLAVPLLLDGRWYVGLLLGAVAPVTATLGDFGESALKRDLGIKDTSALLPGHGGLLDRLDSLLATAPVMYLLLTWLVP